MRLRHIILMLLGVLGVLVINNSWAKSQVTKHKFRFPVGCVNVGYQFDLYNVVLKPSSAYSKQTIYFIRNKSNKSVYLHESVKHNKGYLVYTNGQVSQKRWSVLAVAKSNMKFTCTTYDKRKHEHRVINCKTALDICEFPRAHFGSNHRGTYWLIFNESKKEAMRIAKVYGIWLNAKH